MAHLADDGEIEPHVIVLDLNMPEMDGREFDKRARGAGYTNPIVILSAYA